MDAAPSQTIPPERTEVELHVGDEAWLVRLEGRTISGSATDRGASLLLLTFAKADRPDERLLERLVASKSLDDLDQEALGRLIQEAKPHRAEWSGSSLFSGTRRGRGR